MILIDSLLLAVLLKFIILVFFFLFLVILGFFATDDLEVVALLLDVVLVLAAVDEDFAGWQVANELLLGHSKQHVEQLVVLALQVLWDLVADHSSHHVHLSDHLTARRTRQDRLLRPLLGQMTGYLAILSHANKHVNVFSLLVGDLGSVLGKHIDGLSTRLRDLFFQIDKGLVVIVDVLSLSDTLRELAHCFDWVLAH